MGRKCGVKDCLSDSQRPEDLGVTFHKIPHHTDIRPKWLELCRIAHDRKVIYVCSRHFLRADFCNFKGKKYMLKQGVLPSIFPWNRAKLKPASIVTNSADRKIIIAADSAKKDEEEMAVNQNDAIKSSTPDNSNVSETLAGTDLDASAVEITSIKNEDVSTSSVLSEQSSEGEKTITQNFYQKQDSQLLHSTKNKSSNHNISIIKLTETIEKTAVSHEPANNSYNLHKHLDSSQKISNKKNKDQMINQDVLKLRTYNNDLFKSIIVSLDMYNSREPSFQTDTSQTLNATESKQDINVSNKLHDNEEHLSPDVIADQQIVLKDNKESAKFENDQNTDDNIKNHLDNKQSFSKNQCTNFDRQSDDCNKATIFKDKPSHSRNKDLELQNKLIKDSVLCENQFSNLDGQSIDSNKEQNVIDNDKVLSSLTSSSIEKSFVPNNGERNVKKNKESSCYDPGVNKSTQGCEKIIENNQEGSVKVSLKTLVLTTEEKQVNSANLVTKQECVQNFGNTFNSNSIKDGSTKSTVQINENDIECYQKKTCEKTSQHSLNKNDDGEDEVRRQVLQENNCNIFSSKLMNSEHFKEIVPIIENHQEEILQNLIEQNQNYKNNFRPNVNDSVKQSTHNLIDSGGGSVTNQNQELIKNDVKECTQNNQDTLQNYVKTSRPSQDIIMPKLMVNQLDKEEILIELFNQGSQQNYDPSFTHKKNHDTSKQDSLKETIDFVPDSVADLVNQLVQLNREHNILKNIREECFSEQIEIVVQETKDITDQSDELRNLENLQDLKECKLQNTDENPLDQLQNQFRYGLITQSFHSNIQQDAQLNCEKSGLLKEIEQAENSIKNTNETVDQSDQLEDGERNKGNWIQIISQSDHENPSSSQTAGIHKSSFTLQKEYESNDLISGSDQMESGNEVQEHAVQNRILENTFSDQSVETKHSSFVLQKKQIDLELETNNVPIQLNQAKNRQQIKRSAKQLLRLPRNFTTRNFDELDSKYADIEDLDTKLTSQEINILNVNKHKTNDFVNAANNKINTTNDSGVILTKGFKNREMFLTPKINEANSTDLNDINALKDKQHKIKIANENISTNTIEIKCEGNITSIKNSEQNDNTQSSKHCIEINSINSAQQNDSQLKQLSDRCVLIMDELRNYGKLSGVLAEGNEDVQGFGGFTNVDEDPINKHHVLEEDTLGFDSVANIIGAPHDLEPAASGADDPTKEPPPVSEAAEETKKLPAAKPSKSSSSTIKLVPNARIEALDINQTWSTATIVEVDYEENEVLVHFDSHGNKYDEWICINSSAIRPLSEAIDVVEAKVLPSRSTPPPLVPLSSAINASAEIAGTPSMTVETKEAMPVVALEQAGDKSVFDASVAPAQPLAAPTWVFKVGDRCMAAWCDARKFAATVTKILEDQESYEVLFDDGFTKIVKTHKVSKCSETAPQASPLFEPVRGTKEDRRNKKRKLNVSSLFKKRPKPAAPTPPSQDAGVDKPLEEDWFLEWVDNRPVGTNSSILMSDGYRKSVIVTDSRLPATYEKHMVQRTSGTAIGKWEVMIMTPTGRKLRGKNDARNYIAENPHLHLRESMFDFSVCKPKSMKRKPGFVDALSDGQAASPRQDKKPKPDTTANDVVIKEEPIESSAEPQTPQKTKDGIDCLKIIQVATGFKCPIEGCGKLFRRENLAQMHVKHYHPEFTKFLDSTPNVADLAYARTVGESLDRSPGQDKTKDIRPPRPKVSTPRPLPVKPLIKSEQSDSVEARMQSIESRKDAEIVKLLNSKPYEGETQLNLPSGLPSNMYPDIKLKDLLSKSENVPKYGEVKPLRTGLKTLLPVRRDEDGLKPRDLKRKKPFSDSPDLLLSKEIKTEDALLPPPPSDIIIEGGEIIKIVRMRQEEIINCTCGITEEDGLMIQCELCLCWQHAYCNNIQKENEVPDKYVCYICQHPARQRTSKKYMHDQDWMKHGTMPTASYHCRDEEAQTKRFDKLKLSHDLSGGLLELKDFMHSVKIKIKIAGAKNHPKLYLWSKPWEKLPLPEMREVKQEDTSADAYAQSLDSSMLMSVLKSEKDDAKIKDDLSEFPKLDINSLIDNNLEAMAPSIPQPEAAIESIDCRLNLLDNIGHCQNLIEERLNNFEKQLNDLDEASATDDSDENYAKIRQATSMLLRDLRTLKEFSQIPSF